MRVIFFIFLLFPYMFIAQIKDYSPLQFLYFASQAYNDKIFEEKIPPRFKTIHSILNINSYGFYEDKKSDYQSIAFLDTITSTIIIAHRGTEFDKLKDIHADVQIVYSNVKHHIQKKKNTDSIEVENIDFKSGKLNKFVNKILKPQIRQYYAAQNFTDILKQNYPTEQYSYIHVGHSLGGSIAQLLACKNNEQAITFDAPGIKSLSEILLLEETGINVVNYVVKNSVISNWKGVTRGHLGQIIPLYPYSPHNFVKNNPIGAGKYHSLSHLVNAFDQESGEVLNLDHHASLSWEKNNIQPVGKTVGKPQKHYANFEEFRDFYINRYNYKTILE